MAKFDSTRQRDIGHKKALTRGGWKYLVIWECDIEKRADAIVRRIVAFLDEE